MKKQIIVTREYNSSVDFKYYKNDNGKWEGLSISYWSDGSIWCKTNYVNDKEYGLRTWWNEGGKIIKQQKYHL